MNKIIVENDTMRFYSTPVPIPVGGSQWSKIFFMFSDEWEDLRKIAQFRQGELKRNVDIDSNNFCYVPNEMLPDMCGELSIVGYPQDTASAIIATANSLMLNFVQGFESGGEPAVPPTPDLYQKLIKEFAKKQQSDWNQNDENAQDYIKNRTHWSEVVNVELIAETAFNAEKRPGPVEQYWYDGFTIIKDSSLKQLIECKVIFDNKTYSYETLMNDYNAYFIGNMAVVNPGAPDTGEPFGIFFEVDEFGHICPSICLRDSQTHTIRVSGQAVKFNSLNRAYLPSDCTQVHIQARRENSDFQPVLEVSISQSRFVSSMPEEIVYDLDKHILRTYSKISPYAGVIDIYKGDETFKLAVGSSYTVNITLTSENQIDVMQEIGLSSQNARLQLRFKDAYIECWLFENVARVNKRHEASGLCYTPDGHLYGVNTVYNSTDATLIVTIKRLT